MSLISLTVSALACQSAAEAAIVSNLTPPTGDRMFGKYFARIGSLVSKKFGSKNSPPE